MFDSDFHFDVGQRVKLRDGINPEFYDGMAKVGNEGWIAGRRLDPRFKLPEVFIRWDRDHWADNQQPDCWTYQEHFDPVEGEGATLSDDKEKIKSAVEQFVSELLGGMDGEKGESPEPPEVDETEAKAKFQQVVEKANEAARNSESFLTVFVARRDHKGAPQGMLAAGAIGDSLSPESEMLLGAQLSHLASRFHQEAAMMMVEELSTEPDNEQ